MFNESLLLSFLFDTSRYQGTLIIDVYKTPYGARTIIVTTIKVYIFLKLNKWKLQWYKNYFDKIDSYFFQ